MHGMLMASTVNISSSMQRGCAISRGASSCGQALLRTGFLPADYTAALCLLFRSFRTARLVLSQRTSSTKLTESHPSTHNRAALQTARYNIRYAMQSGVLEPGQRFGLALDEVLLPQALRMGLGFARGAEQPHALLPGNGRSQSNVDLLAASEPVSDGAGAADAMPYSAQSAQHRVALCVALVPWTGS